MLCNVCTSLSSYKWIALTILCLMNSSDFQNVDNCINVVIYMAIIIHEVSKFSLLDNLTKYLHWEIWRLIACLVLLISLGIFFPQMLLVAFFIISCFEQKK